MVDVKSISYSEIYNRIVWETAFVSFVKKTGDIRYMICTRNYDTISLLYDYHMSALSGHDKRCNINNGNIAVVDLVIGEARSFNIERIVDIEFIGEILSSEDLEIAMRKFMDFKESCGSSFVAPLSLDDI